MFSKVDASSEAGRLYLHVVKHILNGATVVSKMSNTEPVCFTVDPLLYLNVVFVLLVYVFN